MKNFIKIFLCLVLTITTIFAVSHSENNVVENVEAANNLVPIKDNSGNVVTYRNSSEPIMRLSEYNYPTQSLRAAWVSNFISSLPSYSTEAKWKEDYSHVLDVMETYGLNCIIFHVRTHNNALYDSKLNPVASWFSKVNFDEFDPLEWAVEETHRRGMEFHAWLNPYRVSTNGNQTQFVSGDIPAVNPVHNSSNLLQSGDSIILNPGIQSNRDFIVDSCMEVVENYDVDAIHFDDYFYISGVESGKSGDWKRKQVDLFIEDLSNNLREYNKEHKKTVQLGISPSGIYRNGGYKTTPTYDANGNLTGPLYSNTSGFAHYDDYLYSDTLKWINEEWIDYIMPQTYWSLEHTAASYGALSQWWSWAVRNKKVNLYLGMGIYMPTQSGSSGTYWQKNYNEIRDQILNAAQYSEIGGMSLYSYNYIQNSNAYIKPGMELLKNDYFATKIPCDIKQYYAPLYDTVPVKNIKVINDVLTFDKCENVRGYMVYQVEKGQAVNTKDINQVYYYGTDLSIELKDTSKYTYYVASVNLANEISDPVNTESAAISAENLISKINKLPSVIKLANENEVKELEGIYYALSNEERTKVTNAKTLLDAVELIEEKHVSIETVTTYKDLNKYTAKTQLAIKTLINQTKSLIDDQPTIAELNKVVEEFKNKADEFKELQEELKDPIAKATEELNKHYNSFDKDFYESQEQLDLKEILDKAIESINVAKSEEDITSIVNSATQAMNQVPNFKAEYEEIIKGISDELDELINESITKNAWFEKRNLPAKKSAILSEVEANNKYKVYMNDSTYKKNALKEMEEYISDLSGLYSKIKAVVSTISNYDTSIDGAKELIDEYVEKIELADSKEQVEQYKTEFKTAYNELENGDSNEGGCASASIHIVSLLAALSLVVIFLRKRH